MTKSKIKQPPRRAQAMSASGMRKDRRARTVTRICFSRYLRVAAGRVFLVHRWEQVSGKLTGKGVDLIR